MMVGNAIKAAGLSINRNMGKFMLPGYRVFANASDAISRHGALVARLPRCARNDGLLCIALPSRGISKNGLYEIIGIASDSQTAQKIMRAPRPLRQAYSEIHKLRFHIAIKFLYTAGSGILRAHCRSLSVTEPRQAFE